MPKTAAFETYADAYDGWFEDHRPIYEAELQAIGQLMPTTAVEAMEVGVGSGKFALPLGIRVGVEPSEKMAARARSQGIDVHAGVAEALPFADECFDLVLMVTTVCFVDDVSTSFSECARVLRPGGSLIVGFVDKASDLGQRYLQKQSESRFYGEATFFTTGEIAAYLLETGFLIAETRQALIPDEPPELILEGSGRGGFIAIKAIKPEPGNDASAGSRA